MNVKTWIVCAALAACAVPALAQERMRMIDEPLETADHYELDSYLDNPCTSYYDRVYVDYSVYLEKAIAETNDRFIFAEQTAVAGTYKAAGSTTSDVSYKAPFTIRKYHKVNTSDLFHVVTVIHHDPAARYTNVTIETACGNGMPDSAQ